MRTTIGIPSLVLVKGWLIFSVTSRNTVAQEFNQARFHLLDAHKKKMNFARMFIKSLFLDSTEYTEKMATFINSLNDRNQVLIVGGPKDSGKTTGIMFISQAAIRAEHYVVELDLKGKVNKNENNGFVFLESFDKHLQIT